MGRKEIKIIYKILERKLKIEQHKPNLKPGGTQVLPNGKPFLLH
jgi:hypothetical protein